MPNPLTETQVPVPNDYTGKTVQWAKNNLATVDLNIVVSFENGEFHPPTTDQLGYTILTNAPGSKKGQLRPHGGNAAVIMEQPHA